MPFKCSDVLNETFNISDCYISCTGADFDAPYPSYEHALMASKLKLHSDRVALCSVIKGMKVIRDVKKLVNTNTSKDIAWWKARY